MFSHRSLRREGLLWWAEGAFFLTQSPLWEAESALNEPAPYDATWYVERDVDASAEQLLGADEGVVERRPGPKVEVPRLRPDPHHVPLPNKARRPRLRGDANLLNHTLLSQNVLYRNKLNRTLLNQETAKSYSAKLESDQTRNWNLLNRT